MKTIITLLITVFTWTASASSIIAQYNFGIKSVSSETSKFVRATLIEGGQLDIEIFSQDFNNPAARPAADEYISVDINDKNLTQLKSFARSLVEAPVVNTQPQVICMLYPASYAQSNHLFLNRAYDTDSQVFVGDLELVLGPEGCWVSNKVHFEQEWQNTQARRIKSTLEVLVNEYAGDLL